MSTGENQPTTEASTGDNDGDGVNNATEVAIDSGARYQARIALVTAIVALVSALLGPLVSLKINQDQIESQRTANITQNKSNREATQDEFIRTERRTVYSDYLSAFNNGALELLDSSGRSTVQGYPVKLVAKEIEKTIATFRNVTATYYTVTLLVSDQASDEANETYQQFARAAGELLTLQTRIAGGEAVPASEVQAFNDKQGEVYGQLVNASKSFVEAGRDDLQPKAAADSKD